MQRTPPADWLMQSILRMSVWIGNPHFAGLIPPPVPGRARWKQRSATNRLKPAICRRCVQVTLAVPLVCLGLIGSAGGKRCKFLKVKSPRIDLTPYEPGGRGFDEARQFFSDSPILVFGIEANLTRSDAYFTGPARHFDDPSECDRSLPSESRRRGKRDEIFRRFCANLRQ